MTRLERTGQGRHGSRAASRTRSVDVDVDVAEQWQSSGRATATVAEVTVVSGTQIDPYRCHSTVISATQRPLCHHA